MKQTKGEKLEPNQVEKIDSLPKLLKEIAALAKKLPHSTEVLAKNQDITDLLPEQIQQGIGKKRQQDQARRERDHARQEEERKKPEFMTRHDRPILSVVVSKDGQRLYTCSKDKYVLCWSLKDELLRVLCTFAGHQGAVWGLDVSHKSSQLASGSADGCIHFWRTDPAYTEEGAIAPPASTLDHGGIVRVLRWCPFDEGGAPRLRLATASEKLGSTPACIAVWNAPRTPGRKPELVLKLTDIPTKANDLQWGSGGVAKLFSAHDNGYIGVWNAVTEGPVLKTIKLHSKPVAALCLTPDGKTLLTASHDCTARAVDISKPAMDTLAIYKTNRTLNAVAVSADYIPNSAGLIVVAGGKDARDVTTSKDMVEDEFEAKVFDAAEEDKLLGPQAVGTTHFGPIHCLQPLPDLGGKSGAYVSVSEDGCIKVHGMDGRLLRSDTL